MALPQTTPTKRSPPPPPPPPPKTPVNKPKGEAELWREWREIVDGLAKLKSKTTVARQPPRKAPIKHLSPIMDRITFSHCFKELIHSGKYTSKLIDLELSYWPAMREMIETKNNTAAVREKACLEEVSSAIQLLGRGETDESISALSKMHCIDIQRITETWNKSIDALKDSQREDYWQKMSAFYSEYTGQTDVIETEEDRAASRISSLSIATSKSKLESPVVATRSQSQLESQLEQATNPIRLEESFTINLGTLHKTAHNLRILAVDSLAMVDTQDRSPRVRTQTAMSLYSTNLTGAILLVDNQFESYSGLQYQFKSQCESLTDFHFDSLGKQVNYIKTRIMPTFASRNELKTGDCYVTRHSNLSNTHIVFHLVTDDSLRSCDKVDTDPVMNTLRYILRLAHAYDIRTISVPLLLIDEMNEEILTVEWCLKRAELVLKRVKGFLIEMASQTTDFEDSLNTIQFLVLKGISDQLFASLAGLISEIFRLSTIKTMQTTAATTPTIPATSPPS